MTIEAAASLAPAPPSAFDELKLDRMWSDDRKWST